MKKLIIAVLVLAAGIVVFYRPARVWALVQTGRANGCPLDKALAIDERFRQQTAAKDRILAASKQIRKDDQGFALYETPYGPYWIPVGDEWVLPFNLAEQEMKIYGTGEVAVRGGDVVLDCGANLGVYTREALQAGAKLVIAIEPAPENLVALKRNLEKEIADGRVIVYEKGVWDKDDVLELHQDPSNTAADTLVMKREGFTKSVKVPLTTIDKMVAELKLDRVDYIKMDIEGAEVKALIGAKETIAKYHPRMGLSVYHQADHPVEVPKAAKAGWNGYRIACGPCAYMDKVTIRPDVLYFY